MVAAVAFSGDVAAVVASAAVLAVGDARSCGLVKITSKAMEE